MCPNVPSRKEIRDRWIRLRERLGWTQADAGRELGIPGGQAGVAQFESAKRPIPQKYLAAMAARAGEVLTYFYDGGGPDTERRDRLIAADWMERTAKRLREEATAPPSGDELQEQHECGKRLDGEAGGTTGTCGEQEVRAG